VEQRRIGSLEVSVVGLGCNNFGMRIDEEQTKVVVDAAIESGINFFDTADIYGKTKSEQFLGRALGSRRGQVVIASKFGMEVDPERKGAKPEYVRQACEDSLQRLGTEYIDLYQLHEPDPSVPIADTLGALDDLVKAGKVREIGCSNFSVEQLQEAEREAKGAKFVSVQNEYSLLERKPEMGVLQECERQGVAFLPYFPLASGLLTGKYRKGAPLPEGTRIQEGSRWLTQENVDAVEVMIDFAESRGHTILELAFSWLVAHNPVASVIAGATKAEQIRNNIAAVGWKLNRDDLKLLDATLRQRVRV
jgi:aryl-alcohol dehydrogenase-like predicted oxidoreductase